MSTTPPPDDFDDREMRERLEEWGRAVSGKQAAGAEAPGAGQRRGEALFGLPESLSALHRSLDAMDQEIAGAARPTVAAPRRWIHRLSLAAALAVAALGAWAFLGPGGHEAAAPTIGRTWVSLDERLVRSGEAAVFRSGEVVYVRLELDRSAAVFAAMLDARLVLAAVSTAPRDLPAGPQALGPFELDDVVGTESFVLIAGPPGTRLEDFRRALASAARAAGPPASHEAKLAAALAALRAEAGFTASGATFEHLPR